MADEKGEGTKVLTEWMGQISGQLADIHSDLNGKADRSDLKEVDEKVNRAHKKINLVTGAWGAIMTGIMAFLGIND